MDLHVLPIPIPPPASLSTPSLWVFPVHQPRALVSCIQPGLVKMPFFDKAKVALHPGMNKHQVAVLREDLEGDRRWRAWGQVTLSVSDHLGFLKIPSGVRCP